MKDYATNEAFREQDEGVHRPVHHGPPRDPADRVTLAKEEHLMRASLALLLTLVVSAAFSARIPAAQSRVGQTRLVPPRTTKPLDIYVVDVEGGNATLFVSPSGRIAAHRYRQRGRRARSETPVASWPRSRTPDSADRSSDHDALARRSLRRHGRAGLAYSDSRISSITARTSSRATRAMSFCRRRIRSSTPRRSTPLPNRATGLPSRASTCAWSPRPARRSRRRCPAPAARIRTARISSPETTTPRTRNRSGPT